MTPPVLNVLTTVMSSLVRAELPAPCTWLSRYIFVLLKKKITLPTKALVPCDKNIHILAKSQHSASTANHALNNEYPYLC